LYSHFHYCLSFNAAVKFYKVKLQAKPAQFCTAQRQIKNRVVLAKAICICDYLSNAEQFTFWKEIKGQ